MDNIANTQHFPAYKRITVPGAAFRRCMEIYDYSFPYEEKRSMDNMVLSLKDGRFHFLALYADEEKAEHKNWIVDAKKRNAK